MHVGNDTRHSIQDVVNMDFYSNSRDYLQCSRAAQLLHEICIQVDILSGRNITEIQ